MSPFPKKLVVAMFFVATLVVGYVLFNSDTDPAPKKETPVVQEEQRTPGPDGHYHTH